jgi:hypothetical protein
MDLPIPEYSSYAGVLQDPMKRLLLEQYMGDLGYDTQWGAPQEQIGSLEQQLAGYRDSQLGSFLEGRDPRSALKADEYRSMMEQLQNLRAEGVLSDQEWTDLMVSRPRGELYTTSFRQKPWQETSVRQARDFYEKFMDKKIKQGENKLQSEISQLRDIENTPTFAKREGYDPNAELNQMASLGAGSIDQLYDDESKRTLQALRSSAARRGLYRSGMAQGQQQKASSELMKARNQAKTNYGMDLYNAASNQRAQRLGRIASLLGGEEAQQNAAYANEMAARNASGNYMNSAYNAAMQGYQQQQQERQNRMNQLGTIFGGFDLFGRKNNGPQSSADMPAGGRYDYGK